MAKELRIGVTEPAPNSPAFALSRDSAGILIGVRDKAAPQFAVSRDAEGLLLSAWPVTPAVLTTGLIGCLTGNGDVVFGMASVRPVSGRTASVRSSVMTALGTANPYLVTAPTAIVAGDLLVMALASWQGYETGAPAGWTLVGRQTGDDLYVSLYARQATADDEGAPSYAVPNGDGRRIWAYTWAIADGLDVDFSAFCYEPYQPSTFMLREVISADGFAAMAGSVFCVIANGRSGIANGVSPYTTNNDPAWTRDATNSDWALYYAWHAVWGT